MQKWYQKELVRSLVDMHIPNGEGYLENFDPKKYAENVKKSGATVAYLYGANCLGLSFYPTKVGLRHKAADRDIFGETVKECRKLGLGVVGYLNSWGSFVSEQHPEWRAMPYSGVTRRDKSRFGSPCVNNDEYIEYMRARVYEFVSMYKLDALWIDMIGMYAKVCFCDHCKRKYGKPLPTTVDINDPAFIDYIRYKGEQVATYVKILKKAAKEADPDIDVILQSANLKHPLKEGCGTLEYCNTTEFLSGDYYEPREGVNALSRMLYKLTPNLPFEFMTSRCVSLERHTMNKDINELILQSYAALMYKGSFLFIDAIDPDGSLNPEFYDDISVISRNLELYKPYIDFEEKPLRDVALYFNFESDMDSKDNGKCVDDMGARYNLDRMKNMDIALSNANIDYDIISPKNLSELANYKAIVLSSLEALSEEEVAAIREYVANGGCVYASAVTSMRDTNGNLKDNFMLSDVFGVDYKGKFDIKPNYIAPVSNDMKNIFGRYTRKYPHMLEEKMFKVLPNGNSGKTLATVTLPVSDSSDIKVFSSAISDPPINETEYVALYENKYGKGRAIYSAGRIENDKFSDNMKLFTNIVDYLVGEYRAKIDAPSCVDYTVYEKNGVLKVNLLNHQTIYPPIKISDVGVSVKVGDKQIKSVKDVTGGKCEWSVANGVLKINTDLDIYKLIVVETI